MFSTILLGVKSFFYFEFNVNQFSTARAIIKDFTQGYLTISD